jgi:hypothetical protein
VRNFLPSIYTVFRVTLLVLLSGTLSFAQTSKKLFEELYQAGGVHPLAEFVCFPEAGHDQDKTFVLIAFSNDFASTLRAKKKPVPQEFLEAEKAPEKGRFLIQWVFRDGVQLHEDPETLQAVDGSGGHMWSVDMNVPSSPKRFTLRMVFSEAGRYRRDVLVDGTLVKSVPGRFEPIR